MLAPGSARDKPGAGDNWAQLWGHGPGAGDRQLSAAVRTWAGGPWPGVPFHSQLSRKPWLPTVRVFLFHLTNTGANLGFIPCLLLTSWINSSYPPTNTRAICQPFIPQTHIWETLLPFVVPLCLVSRTTRPIFLSLHEPEELLTTPNILFILLQYPSGLSQPSHPRMVLSPNFQVQGTIQWSEFVCLSFWLLLTICLIHWAQYLMIWSSSL